jgi:hypothetical protein
VKTLCLLLALLPVTAYAQRLGGRVQDGSGAPVAAAAVTLTSEATNQRQRAATGGDGAFQFRALSVGAYALRVEKSGFAPLTQHLTLNVGQALDIPVTLSVAASEQIEVRAAIPIVETGRTAVAANVTPEEVQRLPLNGRNYLDLALLVPGVSRTNVGANQRFAETSAVPGSGISISAQRNLANSFLVDGLSANDDAAELAGTFFSQEVIREFQVVRSSGSAELGRASGGIINIVTQSGANAVRGDAYLYLRDDSLDATNPLATTKLPLDQKQYGVTLSGPLVRDRLFFFSNLETMRQRGGGVITIDAANVAAINARLASVGYPGPAIATGNFATALDSSNVFLRADAALAPAAQLMVRYGRYAVDSANARNAGGLSAVSRATALENHDQTLAVSGSWTPASDLISETRAQATRSRLASPPNDLAGPAVNIAGIASFGTATFSPTARDIDLVEGDEVLTWLRGRHAVKAGAAWLQNRVRIAFPGALQGVYGFSNLADFLAGRYSTFQQAFGNTETRQTNDNAGVFIEDEWRVSPRLLVNGGIRYDVQRLPAIVKTDRDNVAPRLGLAFDPRGDGTSVLRAAAGLYYDRIPLRAVANALQRDGVTYRVAQVAPGFPGAPQFPNVFAAFPSNVLTNITTIDRNIENSSSVQATLQYERQIGGGASASAAYEHLRGHGIIMSRNVNVDRADPRFANNNQYQSIGDSWYDGVTLSFAKRPTARSSFRASYTYSKAIDTAGNFFFSAPQDNHDIAAERGRSDNDQRHRLTLSGSLTARGWMLSSIFTYTSPLPFNIQLPFDRNGDSSFNDRPAGVGRNTGRGFDYRALDLRVARRFALGHGASVDASLDAFNVFNRANYQVPNNIITSPTFGLPTAANDPRQLQLGVRIAY